MRQIFLACSLIVGLAGMLHAEGSSTETDPKIDPEALALVTSVATHLAAQPALQVNWFVSFDEVLDGREKINHFRSGQSVIERGTGYYAYLEQENGQREFFFDGETVSVVMVEKDAYVSAPFDGSFTELAEAIYRERGEALPIWQVLVPTVADELLENVTSAAYLGQRQIAGRDLHHIALSSYESDLQLWIEQAGEDAPELVMLIGTDPYTQGWPQYRAYFTDWNFAPDLGEGFFVYAPDEDATRMTWPLQDVAEGGN
ncbi:DUF2092 domain-containing protein [Pseudophaeobacter sp.]|uniref:DUF2092 domain-containing protein n=1 Tax=Pseudophaeobacter sp. TaxID=1971739 RepID=UPI003298CD4B